MRKYRLETVTDFWNDLGLALDYIAIDKGNPSAARKLYQKVMDMVATLDSAPKRNKIAGDYFSAKVGNYKIIYKVIDAENLVKLLHFWYSRRDIAKLLA